MCLAEGTVEFACSNLPYVWINVFRVATFTEMTRVGIKRGKGMVKLDNVDE
jgi:hypothetical protein